MARGWAWIAGVCGAALLALPSPASAHVTVNPREATKGGYAKLAFRVPTERENANTVRLEVAFPPDRPLSSVSVRPHQGWTYLVDKQKLAVPVKSERGDITEAVSRITWSASGPATAIKPGEFEEFEVSAGPLPRDVDVLVFKAIQTYSSGEEVRWIEEARTGAQEPQRPAPMLKLVDSAMSTGVTAQPAGAAGNLPVREALAGQDATSTGRLAVLALIAGLAGLVLGLSALLVRPRAR